MSSILPSRSPRYCAPLRIMLGSNSLIVKSLSFSGVLCEANLDASPWTNAVLPTPRPPTMRMLFLRFLHRIRMASRASFPRPMISSCGQSRKKRVHLSPCGRSSLLSSSICTRLFRRAGTEVSIASSRAKRAYESSSWKKAYIRWCTFISADPEPLAAFSATAMSSWS